MLLYFKFRNYACFKDEVVLDMRATDVEDVTESAVDECGKKVIPVAAIFGANASGKTKLLNALHYAKTYIRRSYDWNDSQNSFDDETLEFPTGYRKHLISRLLLPQFLFNNVIGNTSYFEIAFSMSNNIYKYSFELNSDCDVLNESLYCENNEIIVFKRNAETGIIEFNKDVIDEKFNENILTSLYKKTLIVSIGSVLRIPLFEDIVHFSRNLTYTSGLRPPRTSLYIAHRLKKDNDDLIHDLIEYIKIFDNSIIGISLKSDSDDELSRNRLYTHHKIIGNDEIKMLPLENESEGTQTMLDLYFYLRPVLESGSILLVDELTASLHPLLVRAIIHAFKDKKVNRNHAQLIFTTHEVWLLNDDAIRADGIWFTEKDESGVSSLYSLADFADITGDDINFMDRYLQGRFGGVPNLKTLFMPQED